LRWSDVALAEASDAVRFRLGAAALAFPHAPLIRSITAASS